VSEKTRDELQIQIQYALVERLSSSQRRQTKLLQLLDECIFECTDNLRLTYANPAWQKHLGYNEAGLLERDLASLLADDKQRDLLQQYSTAFSATNPLDSLQLQLRHDNGQLIWFELRMAQNGADGFIGSFFCIQQHKNLTAELLQQQNFVRRLSLVASHTTNLVIITDRDGHIEWVNSSFEQRTGYTLQAIIGRKPGALLQGPDTDADTVKLMAEAVRQGQGFQVDIINYDCQQQPYWVAINASAVCDDSGNVTHFIAVQTDISKQRAALETLQEAKLQAESLSEAKSRFMANISHEIRTPLNAVIGSTDILRDTGLTREQARYTDMIRTGSDALLSILDDVLTYSRFEADGIRIQQQPFRLDHCLEEAIDIVSRTAVEKGLALILDIAPAVPLAISADKVRIRQILINLLANAIKFTEQGEVVITVDYLQHKTDKQLILQVKDSGIGIATDRIQQMFEPFVQSDTSSTRQYGGSGLGLAICQQICDAAGGNIQVESELGVGSTFTVNYPLTEDPVLCDAKTVLSKHCQQAHCLIIGKHASLNQAVVNMLKHYDLSYSRYNSMTEVAATDHTNANIILLTSAPNDKEYQQLLARKANANKACVLQINLLGSGKAFVRQGENQLLLNGAFKLSHLSRALEILDDPKINQNLRTLETAAPGPSLDSHNYQGKHVLIVEDNPNNQVVLSELLRQKECRVTCVEHGAAALEFLAQQQTDLVLMDIQMPIMDGITATQHIRAAQAPYSKLPIIAVTANAIYGDKERFLSAGMNDYLAKPIAKDQLYQLLDRYLQVKVGNKSNKLSRLQSAMHHLQSH